MTPESASQSARPTIAVIVPRGEAVRNFLYSDTLAVLSRHARVFLLSVVHDEAFKARFSPYCEEIIGLAEKRENRLLVWFRYFIHEAHFRWLWSGVAQNAWELRKYKARTPLRKVLRHVLEAALLSFANRPCLRLMTEMERWLTWQLRPDNEFVDLFRRISPDLVFNTSHIHGAAGELPAKIAYRMGFRTAGFIFSWDNLTSRSRIFVPYHYYFVWTIGMREKLLEIYPEIPAADVFITGTPQFDFHFRKEYVLPREELCRRIGIDPARPFVLYTTAITKHFPQEHHTVRFVSEVLNGIEGGARPQLVVRTYVKGNSREMVELAAAGLPNAVFPDVKWDSRWYMPDHEDLFIYSGLLRHCVLGINAASTVTLELLAIDKPVINLGMDPPGSTVPHVYRWSRHIYYDHYRPVAESGAVLVAWSAEDLRAMILRSLAAPQEFSSARRSFISGMLGDTLDGRCGQRIGEVLLRLAGNSPNASSCGKE